jgi:hypothetical protein
MLLDTIGFLNNTSSSTTPARGQKHQLIDSISFWTSGRYHLLDNANLRTI